MAERASFDKTHGLYHRTVGMMAQGRNFLGVATYLTFYPGAAITVTALGLNLLGDGLRDRLDPRFHPR